MARIEKTVFISYRRTDVYTALAVYQDLTSKGYDVFFDYTSISSGDFEQIIISNIRARAHFLLILTPTALDRVNEPGDWLRREIETAIDEKRNIVPLFFKGFNFGSPTVAEKLTGKLADLRRYNGLNVHEDYFRAAMERLSKEFLNVPLTTVLHPVSTDVKKVVRKEQNAVNEAIVEKWQDLKELFKSSDERTIESKHDQLEQSSVPRSAFGSIKSSSIRLYGIGLGFLLLVVLGLAGLRYWSIVNDLSMAVAMTSDAVASHAVTIIGTSEPSSTAVFSATTIVVPASTPTPEPTLTVTPTSTLGVGSTKVSTQDGMVMVYVPAGQFTMEVGEVPDNAAHEVTLDAFWMDKTEVTNTMYSKCVAGGGCDEHQLNGSATQIDYYDNPDFDQFPVIYVSWIDAGKYCKWAGRSLPTEAQWEKAARGEDNRQWPWGNAKPNKDLLNYASLIGDTTKVGSYPDGASPYGVLDMAGNVWEWVADRYDPDYYDNSISKNPPGPLKGQYRVLRGGSWLNRDDRVKSVFRGQDFPTSAESEYGFRCAVLE